MNRLIVALALLLRSIILIGNSYKRNCDMCELLCPECDEYFNHEFPFGDDVKCPNCGVWLETDMEEDWDNLYFWVVGKSDNWI